MATTNTGLKRAKTSEKARVRNKTCKAAIKTIEKRFRTSLEKDVVVADVNFKKACSKLDKAANTGKIHKNKANRKKSRLAKVLNTAPKAK